LQQRAHTSSHEQLLQAKTEDLVTADYAGDGGWGDDDPSVFIMNIVGTLQGEYQVTNGYGPQKAPQVMQVSILTLPSL